MFLKSEFLSLLGSTGKGMADIPLSRDMSFSKEVQTPLMVITDQQGSGAGEAILEAWNPGHNLNPSPGQQQPQTGESSKST